MLPKKYKVAEISIDEEGRWWFGYVGVHPEQGGLMYGWGTIGLQSPEDLGKIVADRMAAEEAEYKKRIDAKKEEENQDTDSVSDGDAEVNPEDSEIAD